MLGRYLSFFGLIASFCNLSDVGSFSVIVCPVPPQRFPPDLPASVDLPALFPNTITEIDCSLYFRASAPATIQWLLNGRPLKSSASSDRDAWVLKVNGSCEGIYQCAVDNRWGRGQVAFRVRTQRECI